MVKAVINVKIDDVMSDTIEKLKSLVLELANQLRLSWLWEK